MNWRIEGGVGSRNLVGGNGRTRHKPAELTWRKPGTQRNLAEPSGAAEPSGTRRNPAKPGGTRRNPAEPGETRRNPAEPGGTRRNPAEPGGNLAETRRKPGGTPVYTPNHPPLQLTFFPPGFCQVPPGFRRVPPGFRQVSAGFRQVPPGSAGFRRVPPGFAGFWQVPGGFPPASGFCKVSAKPSGLHQVTSSFSQVSAKPPPSPTQDLSRLVTI